ncbi:MAG TPA: DUF1579 family protein [Gemmatimonadales bacterium]|nr:DUF1579 family protein [Gemmatimonadales bacterium]
MMRALHILSLCALASLAAPQLALAQAPGAQKPGPEHKRLGFFVGKWNTEGEMKPGPMGPGGKMKSTDTCEWFEGNYSVICRYEGSGPMGPSKGIGILGYNPEEKVYTYYGVDNSSMNMASVPKGRVKGDTWTYTDEGTMGGKKFKTRVTIREVSPTEQSFRMEMQGPDGKWATIMESKGTKES